MDNEAYLSESCKNESITYFDTVWGKNIPHINIGSESNPFYLPQEMFKITDEHRKYLVRNLKKL